MRKRRMRLSPQEQELYELRMSIYPLKKKYFKDLVETIEKPKSYKIIYMPSKKDINDMVAELTKSLGIDLNDPTLF